MTEDQARLTRCCGPEGCGGNSANEADRYCIASACMAWRNAAPLFIYNADPYTGYIEEVPGTGAGGFCGLAGQP